MRRKLIILFLLIGLIPALSISVVAYITISRQLTAKTTEQLVSIAIKQDQKINSLLQKRREETSKVALSDAMQHAVGLYNTDGTAQAKEDIHALLMDAKSNSADMLAAYIVDPRGKVIASTQRSAEGTTLASQDYFVASGEPNTISLREDPSDSINKLFIAANVVINRKNAAAVLVKFNINTIVAAVEDYSGLGATGETIIAIKKGQDAVSLFPLRFDPTAAFTVKVNNLDVFDTSSAVHADVSDYRGQKVMVATRYIDTTKWALATKIDTKEALGPIATLRNSIILISLSASAAIILVALFFSRRITKPIMALTQTTREIMSGNFTKRIAVAAKDEVGVLAANFNEMTAQLAESYRALEEKVASRTSDLNQKVQELSEGKAKDDAILSSIGDGMIVTDSEGIVLMINALATELLGITYNGHMSYLDYALYDEGGQPIPPEQRPLRLALSGQREIQAVQSIRPDKSKVALLVTATPVMQNNKVIGAVETIRDVTKEKEVDRMKTEFLSIASHQLRTPLSAIRWFSEMLLNGDAGKLATEQGEFVKNISDSTQRMIDLVNSLLNISRIESGRIIIDPKPTDLRELVTGIINDLKGKTAEKEQAMVISVHKDLPPINIDPRLIGQVYLNLLTNAIKYTPKGGEISVLVSRKGEDVISQVSDNGYGIPKSEQAKMFQKFFRATNIIKVESDGTGLGMYLVKSIIESSGGKIWFDSEEGKGTTFWFSLPMSGMKAKAGEVELGS